MITIKCELGGVYNFQDKLYQIKMRVGMGYDVHRLVEDRKLILGGVTIEYEKGLLGHSDADVLVHAVMDALLGACALGDIGKHFPDTDERFCNISSLVLLSSVKELIESEGYMIENIDATVIAQKPKLASYLSEMAENMARILKISKNQINVKATTEEGLGFTGIGDGISAQAVCLLSSITEIGAVRDSQVVYAFNSDGLFETDQRVIPESASCQGCQGCCKKKV